jgi:TP901 family phage tail tape measure protein
MSETTNIQLNIQGNVFIAIEKIQAEFNQLIQRVTIFEGEVKDSFNTLNKQVSNFKFSLKQISFSAIAENVRNLSEAFSGAAQPGLDFEQKIADLSAITGLAGSDLDVLSEAAREVGKSSGLGAGQAAEAFKLLASNIDVTKIGGVNGLKALQKETITLSQAAGVDLPMAADTMSFALNQFNLPATEAARVINVLGAGAKFGAAEIPDLAESLKNAGSVANAAGVNIETTVGAIEVLSQNAIKGSEAGTALRNILLKLQTKDIPGVDLKTQGLSGALAKMTGMLDDTTQMEKIFGAENINAATILIKNAESVGDMTNRVTGTNVAYQQAEIRTKTYAHELEKVRAKMDDLKISFFNATGSLLPWSEFLFQALVPLSQMVPLFSAVGSAVGFFTNAQKMSAAWTKIATGAQWLWNAALNANPIGIAVAALAALGGAIVWAYNKFDWFRGIVWGVWEGMKAFVSGIKDGVVKVVEGLIKQFSGLGKIIKGIFTLDWNLIKDGGKDAAEGFKTSFSGMLEANPLTSAIVNSKQISNAVSKGYQDGVNDFNQEEVSGEKSKLFSGQETTGATLLQTNTNQIIPSPVNQDAGNRKTDGTQIGSGRNINVKIEHIDPVINFFTNRLEQGTARIKEEITKAIVDSVRDSEIKLSGH